MDPEEQKVQAIATIAAILEVADKVQDEPVPEHVHMDEIMGGRINRAVEYLRWARMHVDFKAGREEGL